MENFIYFVLTDCTEQARGILQLSMRKYLIVEKLPTTKTANIKLIAAFLSLKGALCTIFMCKGRTWPITSEIERCCVLS